jgi:hypothetical protein
MTNKVQYGIVPDWSNGRQDHPNGQSECPKLKPLTAILAKTLDITRKTWVILSKVFYAAILIFVIGVIWTAIGPWIEDRYYNLKEGDPYLKVWINPEVKTYYCPGDNSYGSTIPGYYSSQAEARQVGYHSAKAYGLGCGDPARPLRTFPALKDIGAAFGKSTAHWSNGVFYVFLDNRSEWEITEVSVNVTLESGKPITYRLTGRALPKSPATFQSYVEKSPEGKKWRWNFEAIKGFAP